MTRPPREIPDCPACGVRMAYTPHRAGDCLNPDCWRLYTGPRESSLVGISWILRRELERDRDGSCSDAIAIPRSMAARLVELLPVPASLRSGDE